MGIQVLRRIAGGLILAAGGVMPGTVLAQAGLFAMPSLVVAEVYDDNLFFSSSERQKDNILRISPAIDAGYQSARMVLQGRYAFDAENYARHPELDSNRAREHAGLDFRYEASQWLTVAADAAYTKTKIPGELSPETGLEFRRAPAERVFFSPSLVYRADRLSVGTMSYGFTRDTLAGGGGSDRHTIALDLGWRVTRRDTASAGYRFGQFRFDTGETVASHALLVGGTREFTPQTTASVLVGPRFSEGSAYPEGSVSLRHKFAQSEFGLAYTSTETTVLGVAGTATTETLGATLSYSFGPSIEVRVAPSYQSSRQADLQARVFSMNLQAGYRVARYCTIAGSYQFSNQRGGLTASGSGEISRNVALLGFVIAAPDRRESASRPGELTPTTLDAWPPLGARSVRRTVSLPADMLVEKE